MNVKVLQQFDDVSTAIDYAKMQYGAYPANNLRKPVLPVKLNSEIIAKYYTDYLEYEELVKKQGKKQTDYNRRVNEINDVIIEFIKEESGLNTIPEQYRDKVYGKAYQDSHGSGFYETYLQLCSLVEIFS